MKDSKGIKRNYKATKGAGMTLKVERKRSLIGNEKIRMRRIGMKKANCQRGSWMTKTALKGIKRERKGRKGMTKVTW